MATTPVLDSDVLIDHLRDAVPGRKLVDELAGTSGFRITAVTAFELALRREYARDPVPADALMAAPCLMLTREAAVRAGGLLRELRAAGAGIDVRDAMQAGICLQAEAPLVTRNARHLARVPGLQVIEPGRWRSRAH
ncbi:MAG: type II toxin-antitoxin system VapC family toxin [Solirubrobacterales bacterium]